MQLLQLLLLLLLQLLPILLQWLAGLPWKLLPLLMLLKTIHTILQASFIPRPHFISFMGWLFFPFFKFLFWNNYRFMGSVKNVPGGPSLPQRWHLMRLQYNVKTRKPTLEILSILSKSVSLFFKFINFISTIVHIYVQSRKRRTICWLFNGYVINSPQIHNIFGYRWHLLCFLSLYFLKDL